MNLNKETISDNLWRFLIEVLIILGLSLNHAANDLAFFLWKIQILYCLIVVFAFTLIFSIFIRNLKKCVFYTIISIVTGIIISVGTLLLPPVIYGSHSMIDFTITIYAVTISKYLIFSVTISLLTAIVGGLLSESI